MGRVLARLDLIPALMEDGGGRGMICALMEDAIGVLYRLDCQEMHSCKQKSFLSLGTYVEDGRHQKSRAEPALRGRKPSLSWWGDGTSRNDASQYEFSGIPVNQN